MGQRHDLHPDERGLALPKLVETRRFLQDKLRAAPERRASHLVVVLDLYARLVVGWAMDKRMPTELPLAALSMALKRRSPTPGLIHHGDRGSGQAREGAIHRAVLLCPRRQYAANRYQEVLTQNGIVPSMSNKGDCWDAGRPGRAR